MDIYTNKRMNVWGSGSHFKCFLLVTIEEPLKELHTPLKISIRKTSGGQHSLQLWQCQLGHHLWFLLIQFSFKGQQCQGILLVRWSSFDAQQRTSSIRQGLNRLHERFLSHTLSLVLKCFLQFLECYSHRQ